MIFTMRDLGVGSDLSIAKKLEMQPLSEARMQQFVIRQGSSIAEAKTCRKLSVQEL
jgi:hypothetical protein